MKKLLILPLLVLLTGCVTYYYPATALEDGVYYAEDDPSYVVHSGAYASVAYYPWSSLDYFYLGYNPYPRYGLRYGYGGYGSGFSYGISYGYSPWHYPSSYYGYYSPWYASHYQYPHYPSWRPHSGYNKSPVNRYVSTAPSGYSGNRGMVIRNRETTKIGKNRLHSDKSNPVQSASVNPTNSRAVPSEYQSNRAGNEVRYRPAAKQTRSRSEPSSPTTSRHRTSKKSEPSGRERRN